jgi:hypothetical protein
MTRSLVPFGLDAADEAALRFYLLEQRDEPEDWAGKARWTPMYRLFNDEWDTRVSDLEGQLRQFYENGLRSWAAASQAANVEYQALYATEPLPAHVQLGAPGSMPYVRWLEKERTKPTFHAWLTKLYESEATGTSTGQERLLLQEIERETSRAIEDLVRRFNGRKAWLLRRAEVEARRKREEERRAKATEAAKPQAQRPARRRYGELPPVPEIITRRPRS